MPARLFYVPQPVAFTTNGLPSAGASLYFYETGTLTPQDVYTTDALTTPHANPVVANGAGRVAAIYLNGAQTYRLIIKDRLGVTLSDDDPYIPGPAGDGLSTLSALASIAAVEGDVAYLAELGREGMFVFSAANLSTQVAADPLQGLYVAPTLLPDGASGAWVRQWDGVNGRPEWFGGIANDGAVDNRAAFTACVTNCPVMQLRSADYWFAGLWKMQTQYRSIIGGGVSDGYATGNGTRIISTNAAQGVVQFGPDAAPATLSDYYRNIKASDLTFMHSAQKTAPGVGNESTAVRTVLCQYLLFSEFDRVRAWEPLIGFWLYGCVRTFFTQPKILRSAAMAGTGDFCHGFWIDGIPAVAAGGNPSIFISDYNFECSVIAITKRAIFADGEFADLFIDRLEASNATTAIYLAGSGAGNYGRIDVHIRDIVADQCSGSAIDISGLNASACVTINGGYVQSKTTAAAVVYLHGTSGTVNIGGGLQIAGLEAGTTIGLHISGQPNVSVDETVTIIDCPRPVAVDSASPGGCFMGTINNPLIGGGTQAAFGLTGQESWIIAPRITGAANAFVSAISLFGAANNKVSIDPSRVDLAAVSGGANKTQINAINITAPGYYTSAGAAGASGAGIFVTGITV